MLSSAYSNDRRFRTRYQGKNMQVELAKLGWFGQPKAFQSVTLNNFSLSGIAICTPLKLKINQQLLLNIEQQYYRLNDIPAVVARLDHYDSHNRLYHYALKYTFGELNEHARNVTYTVLKLIEESLETTEKVA